MRRFVFLMACWAVASVGTADEKRVETRTLTKDGIELKIGGSDGYAVSVDGAPFSFASKLFVVDPAWTKRYYGYNDDRQRLAEAETTSSVAGGEGLVMPLVSTRANEVDGTQTLELLPGRKLRMAVDIKMTSETRGILENRIASIGEGWLSGRSWKAELKDGSTTRGVAPRWAPGTEPRSSTIVTDIRKTVFDLPRGPMEIEVRGDAEISLVDYRRNQWAEGKKYYWFGVLGSELPVKGKLNYEVIITFPPPPSAVKANLVEAKVDLKTSEVVRLGRHAEDRIIPTPKEVVWGEGVFSPGSEIGVFVDIEGVPGGDDVVSEFVDRYATNYGIRLQKTSFGDAVFRVSSADSMAGGFPHDSDEAYLLTVANNRISAVVKTREGLRHAMRSLEQLIRINANGESGFRRCRISDYPSMPFRGIHFFTGKNARETQIKMVSEILAPLKINSLIYQVDYVKWESQPQIHSELLSMDKADAVAVGRAADGNGIDVIPLVNTFGHSEWLLQRPEMRYLADDPEDPYAYDPSNPKVYEICEGIYEEAIEMFKPSIMHIGHDEVSMDGFPKKPANKAIGATQLLINDTVHYYEFLKKKGIRTMIWGDMFLAPGEAPDATLADDKRESARRRSLLPKDILIADWHYKAAPVEDYKSLGIFNQEGFETYACTWFAPDNVVRFAKAAAKQWSETQATQGLIQTTWAGYSFDENSLLENVEQYAAYVLAAEAAWTGGYRDSKDVPFDFEEEFVRRWNREVPGKPSQTGWLANLESAAIKINWSELAVSEEALKALKPGNAELGDFQFHLAGKDDELAAVQLAGSFSKSNQPNEIAIPVSAQTKQLFMAMATPAWVQDGTAVGKLKVTLENGQEHEVPLRYGRNILSVSDGRQTLLAPIAWKSETPEVGMGGAVIHVLKWENPEPGVKVAKVMLESAKGSPGILLFGLSGVE